MSTTSLASKSAKNLLGSVDRLASVKQVTKEAEVAPGAVPQPQPIRNTSQYSMNDLRPQVSAEAEKEDVKDLHIQGCVKPRYRKREESEVYVVRFSQDDEYLAVGLGNGRVKVYQVRTGTLLHTLYDEEKIKVPCTNLVFRANDATSNRTKNVLLATYANGKVKHWHATTGKKLSETDESTYTPGRADSFGDENLILANNDGNQTLCVDYSYDCNKFVTAGSDCTLRIYDENTGECEDCLFSGHGDVTAGHSNRIFGVKFHPRDPHLLVSGSWDNTVQIWDTRAQYAVRSIYGPHICGDAIDFDPSGNKILTGSYARQDTIQLWSFDQGTLLENVPWSLADDKRSCLLYTASFSRKPISSLAAAVQPARYILVGGDGMNEARIFRQDNRKCMAAIGGFSHAVYSVTMSPNEKFVAVGTGSRDVVVLEFDPAWGAEFVY